MKGLKVFIWRELLTQKDNATIFLSQALNKFHITAHSKQLMLLILKVFYQSKLYNVTLFIIFEKFQNSAEVLVVLDGWYFFFKRDANGSRIYFCKWTFCQQTFIKAFTNLINVKTILIKNNKTTSTFMEIICS
jgi:hypothetical protein